MVRTIYYSIDHSSLHASLAKIAEFCRSAQGMQGVFGKNDENNRYASKGVAMDGEKKEIVQSFAKEK